MNQEVPGSNPTRGMKSLVRFGSHSFLIFPICNIGTAIFDLLYRVLVEIPKIANMKQPEYFKAVYMERSSTVIL